MGHFSFLLEVGSVGENLQPERLINMRAVGYWNHVSISFSRTWKKKEDSMHFHPLSIIFLCSFLKWEQGTKGLERLHLFSDRQSGYFINEEAGKTLSFFSFLATELKSNFVVYAWNTLCTVTLEPYIFTGETPY